MFWPQATDYYEAVQNPLNCFSDPDLRGGQAAVNSLGLPQVCSGNFAEVYRLEGQNSRQTWAVKCFTRQVPGLQQRYQAVHRHLTQEKLPFMAEFRYLEQGIRIRGQWFPILKMPWVEGLTLNEFVRQNLERPQLFERLMGLWVKMAQMLRAARIIHGDLQHGNVLLVPAESGKTVRLTLIDYDGMIVPSLANQPSGELGHPSYQHPQRIRRGLYGSEADRFPHLAICTGLRCLAVAGRALWKQYNNGDNLLFRREDFESPGTAPVFQELWQLSDTLSRNLVGNLILACSGPPEKVPLIEDLLKNNLSVDQEQQVGQILKTGAGTVRALAGQRVDVDGVLRKRQASKGAPAPKNSPAKTITPSALPILFPGLPGPLPVLLRKPTWVFGLGLWCRRNPGKAVSGATVLALVVFNAGLALVNLPSHPRVAEVPVAALPQTQRLPENDDEAFNALVRRGHQAHREKRYEDAHVLFLAARKMRPEDPIVKDGMAKAQAGKESAERLRQQLTEVRRRIQEKDFVRARAVLAEADKGAPVEAEVQQARQELESMEGEVFEILLRTGQQALQEKRYIDAQGLFFQAEKVRAGDPVAKDGLRKAQAGKENAEQLRRLLAESRGCLQARDFAKARSLLAEADKVAPGETEVQQIRQELERTVTLPPLARSPFDAVKAGELQQAWARYLGRKLVEEVDLGGGVKMQFMLIPPGTFTMGSPMDEGDHGDDEEAHEVMISRPFYMGKYEVTQEEYGKVMAKNPEDLAADRHRFPVENVSWDEAMSFCHKLSNQHKERAAGRVYSLPTEAEWEYACRAGSSYVFHYGNSLSSVQANFAGYISYPYDKTKRGPYLGRTARVGSYKPNSFGLYDMHGNVAEWCADWYSRQYYGKSDLKDPTGPAFSSVNYRVLRGGCWGHVPGNCRAASRLSAKVDSRSNCNGFRVVWHLLGPP